MNFSSLSHRFRPGILPLLGLFCLTLASPVSAAGDAAPPFTVADRNGFLWLVRPDGSRFFSFGVSFVKAGVSRDAYSRTNPAYAYWQHYREPSEWGRATTRRLQRWGFTTIGAWSDFNFLKEPASPKMVFTPVLHMGSTAGAPWWDMWDAKITDRMEEVAREVILPLRDDPRLLGYYSDNEMGWWNAILFKMTLEQAATSGQRQRLLRLLRETYHNDWNALNRDFDPEGVVGWAELEKGGMLYLRPGGNGTQTLRRFLEMLADRYYGLVQQIIRKYDRRALILGDRYQSFYYPEVARASRKYLDVISSNLNAPWNDGTFPRYHLETLHALANKPVLVSEFYMSARENRSGNRNDSGWFPVVATQRERAEGFRTTVRELARLPYVVGAEWFQYFDEPGNGRADGENFNFGLVDVYDRPYDLLVKAATGFDFARLRAKQPAPRRDAASGVPPAPRNPFADFRPTLALKSWDRTRGFVPARSENPLGDLYLCWNGKAVYFGLYAQDVTEEALYRNKILPPEDRAEWIIQIEGRSESIKLRIGGGKPPECNERSLRVENISGYELNVRNIAAVEIPASFFGRTHFRAGDRIGFASTFIGHARSYRMEWAGDFPLQR